MQSPERMQGGSTVGSEGASEPSGTDGITQIKRTAEQSAEEAKGTVRAQIDQRSTEAGQKLRAQVNDLRKLSGQLKGQGQTVPAQLVDRAVEPAERFASYLESSDADRIVRDVEDFARRQPWAVAGAAFVVGLAAARLLKASSSERSRGTTRTSGALAPRNF